MSAALALVLFHPAMAEAPQDPRTTFGTLGLVEMPSARMEPDGTLSAGASFFQDTQRYYINFQVLPWLETSLRYAGLRNFEPALPDYFEVYWDRSFAVKARLIQESRWLPDVSVGLNDLIGTGVYSGEYVVATKQLGALDATIGMGWGRLGDTGALPNPFGALGSSFKQRPGLAVAGGTDFNVLFHGPRVGLFGGLVWHTPIDGLALATEYSSDKYSLETQLGLPPVKSQLNYGITYQFGSAMLSVDWLYGHMIGGSLSLQTDPTVEQYPAKLAPVPPQPHIRTAAEQQLAIDTMLGKTSGHPLLQAAFAPPTLDGNAFADRLFDTGSFSDVELQGTTLYLAVEGRVQSCRALVSLVQAYGRGVNRIVLDENGKTERCAVPPRPLVISEVTASDQAGQEEDRPALTAIRADAAKQEIGIEAIKLGDSEATVYYTNRRYQHEDDALNRLILVLMQDAPARIEKFRLMAMADQEIDVLRAPMERAFSQNSSAELLGDAVSITRAPADNPILAAADSMSYPRFSWDIFPQLRQNLFDPNNPLALQLIAGAEGKLELFRGFSLNAEGETTIFQNIPNRPSDSLLPHVRSDLPLYVHRGGTGIGLLDIDYRFRFSPDLFAAVRAGYLESMFAGIGGEVLWWPARHRWALGADLYEVQQRNFDRLFGLLPYRVTTGHVSLYYQSPWDGLNFELRVGRYLAGDSGITFQVTRRFSTGVEIGAFFTKTNVSAAQFGEGSFDKGLIIRIPLGWALPVETQGEFDLNLRPLQRDGGQTLDGDATLYRDLYRSGEGEIDRHADSLINP